MPTSAWHAGAPRGVHITVGHVARLAIARRLALVVAISGWTGRDAPRPAPAPDARGAPAAAAPGALVASPDGRFVAFADPPAAHTHRVRVSRRRGAEADLLATTRAALGRVRRSARRRRAVPRRHTAGSRPRRSRPSSGSARPRPRAAARLPFEHVTVRAHAARADPDDFADYLACGGGAGAATFPNLGGDATLVAPCERSAREHYGHVAASARGAPAAQHDALWRQVGAALRRELDARRAADVAQHGGLAPAARAAGLVPGTTTRTRPGATSNRRISPTTARRDTPRALPLLGVAPAKTPAPIP